MTAETLPPLSVLPAPDAASTATRVRVDGDRIVVDRLVVDDPALAAFLAERPADDRADLVERAVRIGLLALQDAGVTVNVDVVRARVREARRARPRRSTRRPRRRSSRRLRTNFADGDGRLPRTLEKFLGDRGALRSMVDELFDETKRDSAIGRIGAHARALLRRRRLQARAAARPDPAQLADAPVPPGDDRRVQVARGAARRDRGGGRGPRRRARPVGGQGRRLRGPARGDARPTSPVAPATCSTGPAPRPGAVLKSKKGDFVLTLDPRVARGCDLRVVIEAKDRPMSMRAIREELREAQREPRRGRRGRRVHAGPRAGRGRAVQPGRRRRLLRHRPGGARARPPSRRRSGWPGSWRSRRSSSTRSRSTPRRSRAALTAIREQLEVVRSLKAQLTSISTATKAVWSGLDTMRVEHPGPGRRRPRRRSGLGRRIGLIRAPDSPA